MGYSTPIMRAATPSVGTAAPAAAPTPAASGTPAAPAPASALTNSGTANGQPSVALVDPTSQIQQILAAFQPQAQQSQMNLNDALAAAGVTGGGVVGATDQLQGQLASGLGNSLASAIATANSGNQSATNNANSLLAQLQNSDYLQQLQDYAGINEAGLSGQQGLNSQYANSAVLPTSGIGSSLGALTGALGNSYGSYSSSTPNTYDYGASNYGTYPDGTAAG